MKDKTNKKHQKILEMPAEAISVLLSGSRTTSIRFILLLFIFSTLGLLFKNYIDSASSDSSLIFKDPRSVNFAVVIELDGKVLQTTKGGFTRFDRVRPGEHFIALIINEKVASTLNITLNGGSEKYLSLSDFKDLKLSSIQSINKSHDTSSFTESIMYDVIIDPGHGGGDLGSVGSQNGLKVQEKDIALSYARNLQSALKNAGFSSILTRNGDTYVGLRKRAEYGRYNCKKAFISIHSDFFRNKRLKGPSVYVLSDQGKDAEVLRISRTQPKLGETIRNNFIRNSPHEEQIAEAVLHNLNEVWPNHGSTVQNAGFTVLKGGGCPSMFLELGYLSNTKNLAELSNPAYQNKISASIVDALKLKLL